MELNKVIALWILAAPLFASPAGVFAWNGDPTVLDCSINTYTACNNIWTVDNLNGITSWFDAYNQWSPLNAVYDISRTFTVTSAGGFLISLDMTMNGTGEVCPPFGGCGAVNSNFAATASGFGSPVLISTSGSTNTIPYLTIGATGSELLVLDPGAYTLIESVSAQDWSPNSSGATIRFEADIAGEDPPDATPEPGTYMFAAAWLGVIIIVRSLCSKTRKHLKLIRQ